MAYRELSAPGPPSPHVACLWLRDPEPVARVHRIVPDACVDVVWVAGGRLEVAGPATGPVLSEIRAGAVAAGVRFRVGAAGSALGLPARELLDTTVPLADLWGLGALHLAERLEAATTPHAALATLTAAVARRLPPPDELDRAVRAAALRAARSRAAVDALGAEVGLGERQLRRRFADAVGYGPKTLQRVLRFQRFLALASDRARAGGDLAALAFEAGYADQAHLTRECRRLAGLPPAALLATGAGPAGERPHPLETRAAPPVTVAA
jgi:AraC-like DNA-binding protein